jgi:SAM-dependent methyltransferase
MDEKTARMLCEINNSFYRDNAASFSATRQRPWPGWTACLEQMGGIGARGLWAHAPHARDGSREFRVFDLACGNLRFEDFLANALPDARVAVYAVDNCNALLPWGAPHGGQAGGGAAGGAQAGAPHAPHTPHGGQPHITYQNLDILEALHSGKRLSDCIAAPRCELSVSFGLMHHVPLPEHRAAILAALVEQTRPGGLVAVSFWQFLNDEARARKAQATHARALQELGLPQLGDNDFLLGWQNAPGTYRYCHSFTDAELDQLAQSVAEHASTLARFAADGSTGKLNSYLLLRVR